MSVAVIINSVPAEQATKVARDAAVSFTFTASENLQSGTLKVFLDGLLAIDDSAFQPGFAGSIITNPTNFVISITSHPEFTSRQVDVFAQANVVSSGDLTSDAYVFNCELKGVSNLKARTNCDGLGLTLYWTNPEDITRMIVVRSQWGYPEYIDDGLIIYDDTPIETIEEHDLEANRFYYYTIFVSYSPEPVYRFFTSPESQVEGLSIPRYADSEGDYVYNLLPTHYRKRDADPNRGSDRFKLKDYCSVIQCGVNVYRGWFEALEMLRDADRMPAGRIGEADNQKGILGFQVKDFGQNVEQALDAVALRRLVAGLVSATKKKGSCPGLTQLAKLVTGWDTECEMMLDPECGVNRIFSIWDGSSFLRVAKSTSASDFTISAGSIVVPKSKLFLGNETTAGTLPAIDEDDILTRGFVLTELGDFACIKSITDQGSSYLITFIDEDALLRTRITGTGSGGVNTYSIADVDDPSFPWQFPSDAPRFNQDSFVGLVLYTSNNVTGPIVANTSGLVPVLTMTGGGNFNAANWSIGWSTTGGTYAGRVDGFKMKIYIGEHSLLYDPVWDIRLANEIYSGPWSFLVSIGGFTKSGQIVSPSAIDLWVDGEHNDLGISTAVTPNELVDSSKNWSINQWRGFYLNPNYNQTRLFKIVGNTTDTLIISESTSRGLDTVSRASLNYVILSEKNALLYERLVKMIPSFLPFDTSVYVKFTGTAANVSIEFPQIISQPSSINMPIGRSMSNQAVFSVMHVSVGTYQWEISTNGGTVWTPITGANSSTYIRNNIATFDATGTILTNENGYKFRCNINNAAGSVTTDVATLTTHRASPSEVWPSNFLWLSSSSGLLNASDVPPSDGDAVKTWSSVGSIPVSISQATSANRLTYRSSVAAFNNKPMLQTDGGDWMKSSSLGPYPQPYTAFTIGMSTAGGGTYRPHIDLGANPNRMSLYHDNALVSTNMVIGGPGESEVKTGATALNEPTLTIATFNGASSSIRRIKSGSDTSQTGTVANKNFSELTIAAFTELGQLLTGYLGDIGVVTVPVTSDQVIDLIRYMKDFYNIT